MKYTGFPLDAIFGTRKNSHYARFTLTETDPKQANSLPQHDISSALIEFSLNTQFMKSDFVDIFRNF